MTTRTLADLSVGENGSIRGFAIADDLRQRLLEMGLTKGTVCTLVRYAPLGDPLELEVRGYRLSIRKAEAEGIFIDTH